MDANSNIVLVKDMQVDDNRQTPYSRGVSNAGNNLVIKNQRYNNLASNYDSGSFTNEFLSILGGSVYNNIPTGAG